MKNKKSHPSFGKICLSRINGGGMNLFGSDIKHDNAMRIEIKTATLERSYQSDFIASDKSIVEVYLSPVQFAELLTSMSGDGIPCTIKRREGKYIEQFDFESKQDIVKSEFNERLETIKDKTSDSIKKAEELLTKKTINKSDRQEILNILNFISTELNLNLQFVRDSFNEEINRMILEGKSEVEAHILNRIVTHGKKALGIEDNNINMIEE